MAREKKQIAKNRKAFHDYEIIETFEAGIALTGTEVCSLRENNCQLTDCFVLIRKGEAWLNGLHISPYSHGNLNNPDPDRKRKLLLHRKQIRYLEQKTREAGLAIGLSAVVPAPVALAVAIALRLIQMGVEVTYALVMPLLARRAA